MQVPMYQEVAALKGRKRRIELSTQLGSSLIREVERQNNSSEEKNEANGMQVPMY
jgi:hypothetical protein